MPENTPAAETRKKNVEGRLAAMTAVLLAVSAAEYWAILSWDGVSRGDKVTAILAIVGAYGLGIGFFRRMAGLSEHIRTMLAELVSPDAVDYLSSNLTYLGILLSTTAIGLKSGKTQTPTVVFFLLSSLALIAMGIGVVVYVIFHLLVVLPVSYPAVLVAAAVVRAFETASGDTVLRVTSADRPPAAKGGEGADADSAAEISLKGFVTKDRVAAAAFIMGLPAATLALIGKVVLPFI